MPDSLGFVFDSVLYQHQEPSLRIVYLLYWGHHPQTRSKSEPAALDPVALDPTALDPVVRQMCQSLLRFGFVRLALSADR